MSLDITKGATRVYIDPSAASPTPSAPPPRPASSSSTRRPASPSSRMRTTQRSSNSSPAPAPVPTQAIIIEQFGRRVYPTILTPMFGTAKDEEERGDE